jgi:hypothetical protein
VLVAVTSQRLLCWRLSRLRRKRPDRPLWALSERPRSVNAGAVLDCYHSDPALVIVDAVDHAVITTVCAVKPPEAQLQRLTGTVRV